jgi:hypothetical protein
MTMSGIARLQQKLLEKPAQFEGRPELTVQHHRSSAVSHLVDMPQEVPAAIQNISGFPADLPSRSAAR